MIAVFVSPFTLAPALMLPVLLASGVMLLCAYVPPEQVRPMVRRLVVWALVALVLTSVAIYAEDLVLMDPCETVRQQYPDDWWWLKYVIGCF